MAGRIEDLWRSGELAQLVARCQTMQGVADALGIPLSTLEKQWRRAKEAGVPSFVEMRYAANKTGASLSTSAGQPPYGDLVGYARNDASTEWEDEKTNPCAPSFPVGHIRRSADYPIPVDAIPLGFGVRNVSTGIDKNGNIEGQWLGARRNGDNYEQIQPSIPVGHALRGVSTLVDETGNVRAQWIKTSTESDGRAAWLQAISDMGENIPRLDPVAAPEFCNSDLLAVYPVGDPHIGLLAWHEDAGENFDLSIAERNLVGAFQHLIALAPAAAEALLVFIGDTAHADGQANTTTKGTRVDVDGRTVKMARTILRTCRRAIDLALAKHGRVTLIVERGNHDELISAMIALALGLAYENEPRVTIDQSPAMYHWYRFGANLIGTHHGDKAKPMDLLGVMAVDRREDWSSTKHRRFYCGHLHHQIVKEVPGLIVEYLPTLASSDAWHHAMGYRSSKAMYMDVLHREWGLVNRHVVGIEQLRAGPAANCNCTYEVGSGGPIHSCGKPG